MYMNSGIREYRRDASGGKKARRKPAKSDQSTWNADGQRATTSRQRALFSFSFVRPDQTSARSSRRSFCFALPSIPDDFVISLAFLSTFAIESSRSVGRESKLACAFETAVILSMLVATENALRYVPLSSTDVCKLSQSCSRAW